MNDENTTIETTKNEASSSVTDTTAGTTTELSQATEAIIADVTEIQKLKRTLSEVYDLRLAITANLVQLQTDAPMVNNHPLVAISLLKLDAIGDVIEVAIT